MNSMIPRRWGARLIAAVTVLAVALPAVANPDGQGPFVDADGTTHEPSITALWAAGITAGCSEWRFCPEDAVSREEMAAFLTRALQLPTPANSPFTDIELSQFAADIDAIAAADITVGCQVVLYCPEQSVTRAQMASFLARALDLPASDVDPFTDDDGGVHEGDIARIAAAGITLGCGDGRFCPDRPVTRAEMAAFLARGLKLPVPDVLPTIPSEIVDEFLGELAMPPWPTGPGAEGWRPLVEEYFKPGDVDRAIRIMSCESLGEPSARNPSSGASGLFQHMPGYWTERSQAAGFAGHSIFDPVANVAVAAWLVYEYGAGGWQHWVCQG